MPVNPYSDFVNSISGIDNISQRFKGYDANQRALASGQKAITDAKNIASQYNSAATGVRMGNSVTTGGGQTVSFGGGGGGSTFDSFVNAIKQQESGGRYGVKGIVTKSGDRALGAYQIMSRNLPSWSKQVLGRTVTANQFLKSPQLQDQIARGILQGYYNKYGAGGAAAAWYGGPNAGKQYAAGVRNTKAQYGGPSIASYVSKVLSRM